MENQPKNEVTMWQLDFETIDKKPLNPVVKQVISKSFQIVTSRLGSMGMMKQISKILVTKVKNQKVAIEVKNGGNGVDK